MKPDSLFSKNIISGIELYYSYPANITEDRIILKDEEFHHSMKVMRHVQGDVIYITEGAGNIYLCHIELIGRNNLIAKIDEKKHIENKLSNIYFCFPRLKSPDRFEFALEKCVELGITNFLIFDSTRGIAKGGKAERWSKILLAAMKQSLRTNLPTLEFIGPLKKIAESDGVKIVLEQEAGKRIKDHIIIEDDKKYYFVFGPEGGLTQGELDLFNKESLYSLNSARLRSETAIVSAAVIITGKVKSVDVNI